MNTLNIKHWQRLALIALVSFALGGCSDSDDDDPPARSNTNSSKVAIPVNFEGAAASYELSNFDGGTTTIETNPSKSGINTSNKVAKMVKDGKDTWGGSTLILDTAIDLSTKKVFTMKVWASRPVPVLFKLEHSNLVPADGEEMEATHTGTSAWETLTFDFTSVDTTALGDVTRITIIFDNGTVGDATNDGPMWTFYFDDITQGAPSADPVAIPVNFEGDATRYTFANFEGGDAAVIDNPNKGGTNTSEKVGQMVKDSGMIFGGSTLTLDTAIDFTTNKAFTMKVWASRAVPVLFKLEHQNGQPADGEEKDATHTGASGWEELTFDFSCEDVAALGAVKKITLIFDKDVVGDATNDKDGWTFYFDDIAQKAGDSSGCGEASAPTDAPTAPTHNAAEVTSVYSDAYTDIAHTDFNPDWGQKTVATEETIANNKVRKYASLNYQGIVFKPSANADADATAIQDVSDRTVLHVDYWTGDSTMLEILLINSAAVSGATDGSGTAVAVQAAHTFTVVTGSWQSVDIPLTTFSGATPPVDLTKVDQMMIRGDGTIYMDNIYFHEGTATPPTPPATAAPTDAPTAPSLGMGDVNSVFSDAYTDIAGTDFNPSWGQATVATEETIASNKVYKYANLNYQGIALASPQNVSTRTMLHVDYWTDDSTMLEILLINSSAVSGATDGDGAAVAVQAASYLHSGKRQLAECGYSADHLQQCHPSR